MANAYRSVLKDAVNPTGNALPADVLAGKTFSNVDGINKTGTMVNNGAVTITLTAQDPSYTVPEGYHNGSGTVRFTPSGGDGADLVVTCSDAFAGTTISCTDGTTTFTEICPSTSPYIVTFESIPTGTWTVSGTVGGDTYSEQIEVTDFELELNIGLNFKSWLSLGGLDPTDYTDLSDVFADEAAVRRLMLVHASADYLIEKVTDDIDTIDDFTANDTAMKWIGLCDYVCDGLTAITGVEAKFLASEYWKRYLKDHVPVMTSTTAPYGTASAYQPFDGNSSTSSSATSFYYKFTNPICVKKFECSASGGTLSGSNDGSTYTDIATPSANTDYYLYYKVTFSASTSVHTLQFYGRSLNVSVPVMTSNTAPYGEAIRSAENGDYKAYKVFDNSASTPWTSGSSTFPQWVGYNFTNPVIVKKVITSFYSTNTSATYDIEASNDGVNYDTIATGITASGTTTVITELNNNNSYTTYRIKITNQSRSGSSTSIGQLATLQFYGVDYTEREFAEGSTMKYLYDHGVELETIDITGTVTKDDDYITLSAANAQASHTLDLTDYDLLRGKVGDHMSGTTALIAGTTATANMTAANAPNNNSLNVSSVNSSLATGAKMTAAGVCDITELWLE